MHNFFKHIKKNFMMDILLSQILIINLIILKSDNFITLLKKQDLPILIQIPNWRIIEEIILDQN